MKPKAFTLAEILITLGIIGVVAAMTLPTLITSNRNKQLETALKRSYSLLSQALNMYQAANGEPVTSENIGEYELKPILMKYLRYVKDCGKGTDIDKACIPNLDAGGDKYDDVKRTYKTFSGKTDMYLYNIDDGQFVLNDGTLIMLENSPVSGSRILITVDVNGYNNSPNRLGHDVFLFQLGSDGRLIPGGAEGTAYYSKNDTYCSLTSTGNTNGAGCTYKALSDKDYFNNLPK